jgi:hypothetical protein
VLVFLSVSRLS